MKNIEEEIRKIAANRNTLTILIVLASVFALYFVYSDRVEKATQMISVPYAKEEITSRTQITSDMIGTVSLPRSVATNLGIETNRSSVLNMYVSAGETIPKNGFFVKGILIEMEDALDSFYSHIPDGYLAFSMSVTNDSTFGNSIYTGNYIDLYVKTVQDRKIVFAKYIESIQVLAVLDKNGNDVFESSTEDRTPSTMWFAVPEDLYIKLMKLTNSSSGMTLVPVPRNTSYTVNNSDTRIVSGSGDYIDRLLGGV